MYIQSNNIKIYPTASRELSVDYGANINLEQNIVGLSNNITDYNSYVVEGLNLSIVSNKVSLSKGICVLKGYSVEIKNTISEIDNVTLSGNDGTKYYLEINLDTNTINGITKINGTDSNNDINTSVYEPITLSLTKNQLMNYNLLLGIIQNNNGTWEIVPTEKSTKFKSDNIQINLPNNSGLVKNNQVYEGSFSNWLRDSFIFDDGDLSDYTQSIDEIFVEYTNGITLNIPTSGLSTTFNGNMIPSVSDIRELVIPAYFTSTTQGALTNASNLESLTIPFIGATLNGVTNTHFGYIFGANNPSQNSNKVPASLANVTISGIVTNISANAFAGCLHIENIILTNTITNIAEYAFSDCYNLISIDLSNNITTINERTFFGCEALTKLELPSGVTSIGNSAFSGCAELAEIIIPDSVTHIGEEVFNDCDNLMITSNNVTYIKAKNSIGSTTNNYFYLYYVADKTVASITIENTCKFIGNGAFVNCANLANITIPSNIIEIEYRAFYDCTTLTTVTSLPAIPPTLALNVFKNTSINNIYVPVDSVNAYKSATNWSNYSSRITAIQ